MAPVEGNNSYRLVVESGVVTDEVSKQLDDAFEFPRSYQYPRSDMMPAWLIEFWSGVKASNGRDNIAYLKAAGTSNELTLGQRKYLGEDLTKLADSFDQMRCRGSLFRNSDGEFSPGPAGRTRTADRKSTTIP